MQAEEPSDKGISPTDGPELDAKNVAMQHTESPADSHTRDETIGGVGKEGENTTPTTATIENDDKSGKQSEPTSTDSVASNTMSLPSSTDKSAEEPHGNSNNGHSSNINEGNGNDINTSNSKRVVMMDTPHASFKSISSSSFNSRQEDAADSFHKPYLEDNVFSPQETDIVNYVARIFGFHGK